MKKRELWIDYLKAFTIFLVIIGHCFDGYLRANTFPQYHSIFYQIRYFIYSFHMPLFFIISGYTFRLAYIQTNEDGCTLNKKRYVRQLINIFLIYFIWAVILWCSKIIMAPFVNIKYDINDLLGMFIVPLGNYWYLYILFIVYVIFGVLRAYKWNRVLLFIASIICTIAGGILFNNGHISQTLYRAMFNILYFGLGVILGSNPKLIRNKLNIVISLIITVIAWIIHYAYNYDVCRNAVIGAVLAMCMSLVIVYIFNNVSKNCNDNFIAVCGKNCIYIYIIHPFFTAGNRIFLPMIGIHQAWAAMIMNIIISTCAAVLISVVCSRIKITDILFKPVNFIERIHRRITDK